MLRAFGGFCRNFKMTVASYRISAVIQIESAMSIEFRRSRLEDKVNPWECVGMWLSA